MSVGVSIQTTGAHSRRYHRALMLRFTVNTTQRSPPRSSERATKTDRMVVKTSRRPDHGDAGRIRRRRCTLIGTGASWGFPARPQCVLSGD